MGYYGVNQQEVELAAADDLLGHAEAVLKRAGEIGKAFPDLNTDDLQASLADSISDFRAIRNTHAEPICKYKTLTPLMN